MTKLPYLLALSLFMATAAQASSPERTQLLHCIEQVEQTYVNSLGEADSEAALLTRVKSRLIARHARLEGREACSRQAREQASERIMKAMTERSDSRLAAGRLNNGS